MLYFPCACPSAHAQDRILGPCRYVPPEATSGVPRHGLGVGISVPGRSRRPDECCTGHLCASGLKTGPLLPISGIRRWPACPQTMRHTGGSSMGNSKHTKGPQIMKTARAALLLVVLALVGFPANSDAATPATNKWGPAVLGGPLADWVHAFGKPMPNTLPEIPGWHPCPDGTTAQILVVVQDNRIEAAIAGPCTGSLTMAQRRTAARLYLPRDATAHGTITSTYHGRTLHDELYTSKTLARDFPAAEFKDCNHNPVPRGTFTVDLHDTTDGGMGMALTVGTCA